MDMMGERRRELNVLRRQLDEAWFSGEEVDWDRAIEAVLKMQSLVRTKPNRAGHKQGYDLVVSVTRP